jgi:hypothetical protein
MLRRTNAYPKQLLPGERLRLKFSALDVFQEGKPTRLYTGKRPIGGALWLDDDRIVFFEDKAIYILEATGGEPRRIFPP